MSDAQRFRDRAKDCRNLAKGARHQGDRVMLEDIAHELEAEADKLETEEKRPDSNGSSRMQHRRAKTISPNDSSR